MDNAEIVSNEDKWLQIDTFFSSLKLSLRAGQKEYRQILLQAEQSFTPYYLGLGAKLNWDIRIAKLHLIQNLLYMQADEQIRNTPSLRGFGELKLSRIWGMITASTWLCRISFTRITKHSTSPQKTPALPLIADARLGVRISKAFEIEALARNLGYNYIFGQMAIPFSARFPKVVFR